MKRNTYILTPEEWNQYKNLEYYPYPQFMCHCGCEGGIKVTQWHRYGGIPNYINHHYGATNECKDRISTKLGGKKKPDGFGEKIRKAKKGIARPDMVGDKNSNYISRETRICTCNPECNETFECKPNSTKRFKNREHFLRRMKDNPPNKGKRSGTVWNKGLTKETDERLAKSGRKISEALTGNPKLIEGRLGPLNPMYGRVRELHPRWLGGTGNAPYPFDFDRDLKEHIKTRDDFTCQLCSKTEKLCVHHINYIKEDLNELNLITLCTSCNGKVNGKRNLWEDFFTYQLLTSAKT